MRNTYEKITENDKLIFYTNQFKGFWEYETATNYKATMTMCVPILGVFAIVWSFCAGEISSLQFFAILLFLLILIFFIIKSAFAQKNRFFELTISQEEINFSTHHEQWTYKVADIEKIKSEYSEGTYSPIFVINGKDKKVFEQFFINQYNTFPIIKDLCQHTGIRLEDEFGNLVKTEAQS